VVAADQANGERTQGRWGEHGRASMPLVCASVNRLCRLPTTCGRATSYPAFTAVRRPRLRCTTPYFW